MSIRLKNKDNKEDVGTFYDYWSKHLLKNVKMHKETGAIHFGYYKKGIKTLKQAILYMNDYVAELLDLKNIKNQKILDAGCGLGATSLYLAKKFPNTEFIGITLSPYQTRYASKCAEKNNIKNVTFKVATYMNTPFRDKCFDKIFALESACYALDHNKFLREMNRILKPNGKIAIVDCFKNRDNLAPMLKKIYNRFCIDFGGANPALILEYKNLLQNNGFDEILIQDISKNVRRSVIQWSSVAAPTYISKTIKKMFLRKKSSSSNWASRYQGNTLIAGVCGFYKIIGYYGVSAVKHSDVVFI